MKNRILDVIGFILIIYAISLGFTILFVEIFESDLIVIQNGSWLAISILLIRPLPYAFAIYFYYAVKELKRSYEKNLTVLTQENDELDIQVKNYKLLDNTRMQKIDNLDKEITELKGELAATVKKEIPFNDKLPYIGQRVKVLYAGEYKEGEITRILDEAIIKYRVKGCGSKKYKEEDMEEIKWDQLNLDITVK